jgi:exportin-T
MRYVVVYYITDVIFIKFVPVQTRFAFARILATAGSTVTHSIPPLMSNLLAHFEPSELVDFMNFIGLLVHKLQVCLFRFVFTLIDIRSTFL